MVATLRYFEGRGVFSDEGREPEDDATERLIEPVEVKVAELYDGVAMSCLKRAKGDQQKADYLFDCSYFEYYYRIMNFNQYVKETAPKKRASDIEEEL